MGYRPDLDTTLRRYAEAWNTEDPDARWALIHACAAPEVTYLGSESDRPVEGQAAMVAFLGMPDSGGAFELGPHSTHHHWVRAPWRRVSANGITTGLLVAELDRQNRLHRILHFMD
ncbi:hypothetical protein B1759_12365 [Rubrivirga sp. SAORIC476]|uniref:hypothetical protein n=1 Tax=Rubrivirga sp. SAORIC476 TaxID=1961794 RepID=UPI000BA9450C|nr:hypothetical protein [Rubrivirga sp. SAORIC476]MAQ92720.1 hypothetical protein [Rhodothermaceae bacterium]MBC14080.1 hypothetical protein [Rhodothermaceae bacterium]PAP79142.1 hypothetical protein B1759_12365 [Rubrivirga sp. SAORIC476]